MDTRPTAADAAARLARLETRSRRLRLAFLAVSTGIAGLGAWAYYDRSRTVPEVDARHLIVRDPEGNVRATLGPNSPSSNGLRLYDDREEEVVGLEHGEQGPQMRLKTGPTRGIQLNDEGLLGGVPPVRTYGIEPESIGAPWRPKSSTSPVPSQAPGPNAPARERILPRFRPGAAPVQAQPRQGQPAPKRDRPATRLETP